MFSLKNSIAFFSKFRSGGEEPGGTAEYRGESLIRRDILRFLHSVGGVIQSGGPV